MTLANSTDSTNHPSYILGVVMTQLVKNQVSEVLDIIDELEHRFIIFLQQSLSFVFGDQNVLKVPKRNCCTNS